MTTLGKIAGDEAALADTTDQDNMGGAREPDTGRDNYDAEVNFSRRSTAMSLALASFGGKLGNANTKKIMDRVDAVADFLEI